MLKSGAVDEGLAMLEQGLAELENTEAKPIEIAIASARLGGGLLPGIGSELADASNTTFQRAENLLRSARSTLSQTAAELEAVQQ